MSKFKIEDIKKEFLERNWTLLSETYVNLQTPLRAGCDKGHEIEMTYDDFRKGTRCPQCDKENFKINIVDCIPKKTKGVKRILAFDQSTNMNGWCVFEGDTLIKYGRYESKGNTTTARINNVKQWIEAMIDLWKPDLVVIEDIQLEAKGSYNSVEGVTTFKILAQAQGVYIDKLYELNIPFDIAHTGVWRSEIGVKGTTRNDKKKSCQMLVEQWYGLNVNDDIADAIGIGRYAVIKGKK